MDTFKWKDDFNVGRPEIDAQHRELLDLLNDCILKASSSKDGTLDPQIVTKLKTHVVSHFRLEEEQLAAARSPELPRQRAEHQYFELQVRDLESGDAPSVARAATLLRDWFIHHVLGIDRATL